MISLALLALLAAAPAIDQVVVFPDRAQVTRLADVTCAAKTRVDFTDITPAAAGDSFRARVSEGAVLGMRAEQKVRAEEFAPPLKDAREKLKVLDEQLQQLHQIRARADSLNRLADQFSSVAVAMVSRELAAEKPDLKAWSAGFDASLKARLSANEVRADTDQKVRAIEEQREVLRRKISQLQAWSQRSEWTVEVLVGCPAGKTAKVELTYLVGGASWTPTYEARAEEAAHAVELSTWATVKQTTGEDWKDAKLLLSTAVPSQNATPPELKKLVVSALEREPEKKVLVRRDEAVERAAVGTRQSGGETALKARSQGLSVQLQVPDRGTVLGEGTPVRLFVAKTRLKAAFTLRAVPRLQSYVFRVADVTNQAPFPLLAGTLDAYRSSGFIARYPIERVAEGGPLTLTFGAEDTVRVKRLVMEELKRDVGLFNGKKRFSYSYRFELANYGKAPVEVELADGLPVSELDDVSVSVEPKTTAGYKLDPLDGIAKWKVALRPGDKKNVDLIFKVDVPNSYDTGNY
ncbi:MAG: Aspartate ammonia-lyase [Myxococcaceae bacterium]|nr:Aspartate ammonia-lyase [Myxococcaceae bacterium]